MQRRRTRRILPAAIALLVVVGCSNGGNDTPAPPPPAEEQPGEASPSDEEPPAEDPEPDEPAAAVELYFVRSGDDRLWIEPETQWVTGSTEPGLTEIVTALMQASPVDPELSSAIPTGVAVLETTIDNGVATIDFSAELAAHSTGSAGEIAFAEQLAHTAAHVAGVTAIRVLIDGEPVNELWGHLDWSVPYEPDPFALVPITIRNPGHGQTLPAGDVTFEGEATVFEAMFMLRLLDASGTVLEEVPVMASAGGPERGDWSATFGINEPGDYIVEAEEDDPSGGEGRPPLVTQRLFTVTAGA